VFEKRWKNTVIEYVISNTTSWIYRCFPDGDFSGKLLSRKYLSGKRLCWKVTFQEMSVNLSHYGLSRTSTLLLHSLVGSVGTNLLDYGGDRCLDFLYIKTVFQPMLILKWSPSPPRWWLLSSLTLVSQFPPTRFLPPLSLVDNLWLVAWHSGRTPICDRRTLLFYARPAADEWPLMWVNSPL